MHVHTVEIPVADIMAGAAKSYQTVMDATNHRHWISLTAADFTSLKAGMTVKKMSCSGTSYSGAHQWALSCDATPPVATDPTCSANCGSAMNNTCP
jgi:hypothetical protein